MLNVGLNFFLEILCYVTSRRTSDCAMLFLAILTCVLWTGSSAIDGANDHVSHIYPRVGSTMGGTRVTLFGVGFSEDQFSFGSGNENKGNIVTFTDDDGHSFNCPVELDHQSNEFQVVCDTPSHLPHDVYYYASVTVDGVAIDSCPNDRELCSFRPHNWWTPTTTYFNRQTFPAVPGVEHFLSAAGKTLTTRFGSNTDVSANGNENFITRVYNGNSQCDLQDAAGTFYDLALDNDDSYNGRMTCKLTGTFVGYSNFTYLIDGPYGRSKTNSDLYHVSPHNDIYTIQTYSETTSVDPSEGSTAGGTWITVCGHYFETAGPLSTYADFELYVGGVPCTGLVVTKDECARCYTPVQPSGTEFPGGRGLDVQYWASAAGTHANHQAIYDLTATPTGSMYLDNTSFCGHLATNYTRFTTFFPVPNTGEYRFRMKATAGGSLFVDGDKVATSNGGWASSSKMNLVKGTLSKLVAVAEPGSSTDCVEVEFRFFDTKLLNSMTGRVTQESQRVKLESPVTNEEYSIAFAGFSSQAKTNEQQTVCPSGNSMGRLGAYGVYTLNEVEFSQPTQVAEELSQLPFVQSGESFTCTQNTNDNTCLDCTFNSDRGNIPLIMTNTNGVTLTSTETVAGIPKNSGFSLMYGGVPSRYSVLDESDTDAFADTLKTMLEDIFSVRCPSVFSTPGSNDKHQGFETENDAVTDVIPFCGRASYKNPSNIFPRIGSNEDSLTVSLKPWLCLAVKGVTSLRVTTNYEIGERTRNRRSFSFTGVSVPEAEGGWTYGCVNLNDKIRAENSGDSNTVKLKRVYIDNGGVDYWVDEIMFSQASKLGDLTDLTGVRLGPGSPNPSEMVLIKEVDVAYDSDNSRYNVTLTPHDCGSKFDLLTLDNAEVTSGSKTFGSSAVTSTFKNGTGNAVIGLMTAATPALKGWFRLAFEGTTTYTNNVNVQLTDAEIKAAIEASSNIGTISVESSSSSTCANRDIYLTYESQPGNRPLATLQSSLSEPSGATASIMERWDGFLEVGPIMGDYIRRYYTEPQVEVVLNKVPNKCADGADCSFTYTSSATPEVTTQSISSGSSGATLQLGGALLSNSAVVMIGDVECTDVTGDASSISCTVGNGPIGEADISVYVPGKGDAICTLKFNYTAGLSGVSPDEGSLGGYLELTLSGFGFSSDSEVLVDGVVCTLSDTSEVPTKLKAIVPPYSDLTVTTDQAVDVEVRRNGNIMDTAQPFTYKPSLTTDITTLTFTNPMSVAEDQIINIGGTGFGANPVVKIGDTALTIDSSDTTSIVASTPVLPPGQDQPLIIDFGSGASLYNDAVPDVDVTLRIDNVFPATGSMLGGTRVTFAGLGFGTVADDVTVLIGDTPCDIDSITNVQIVCDIEETGETHYLNNEGTTGHGVYYAFNTTLLEPKVGDRVKWMWTVNPAVSDFPFAIQETVSADSTNLVLGGITSGAPARTGHFETRLMTSGKRYIYSGILDPNGNGVKFARMTLDVKDRTSSSGQVSVTVKGHEATHNIGGASDPTVSGCALMTSDISGCNPESVTHADTTKFNFIYANCRTPTVTALTFTNVSAESRSAISSTVLTVSGTGFSDANACTNKVKLGSCDCTVTVDSSESLTCLIDSSCDYPIGEYVPLSMDVAGYGEAQIDIASYIDSSVVYVPEIHNLTPVEGSLNGGTEVAITGSGLSGATLVKINEVSATFTENAGILTATTPSYSGSFTNIEADVVVFVGQFSSKCTMSSGSCKFTYKLSQTPTVTDVTPSSISGSTDLTMTGTNFPDDISDVAVMIAGETCTVSAVNATSLTCQVAAIPHGTYTPSVVIDELGSASISSSVSVTGEKTVTLVDPLSGSTNGGTTLTFTGHGFHGVTTVSVGNTEICTDVTVNSLTEIVCTTIAQSEGQVDMVIESDGETYPTIAYTFSASDTPTISNVSPSSVAAGDTLTITGTGFGMDKDKVTVYLGMYECDVQTAVGTSVTCTVGTQTSGDYDVKVHVDEKGYSNTTSVTYQIGVSDIDPDTGSEAGNQLLTINGAGFTDDVIAKVCGEVCEASNVMAASYVCVTPAKTGSTDNCAVTVQDGASGSVISAGTYLYTDAAVPTITSISPTRGGTGGGTLLTITGTGFDGTTKTVSINGVACTVDSSSAIEIQCYTGAHTGSVSTPVVATIDGLRAVGTQNTFMYIDLWSSTFTWGGGPVPGEGELVEIPKGTTIMIDETTAKLAIIVIRGKLIFDESADITVNTKMILIVDGGILEAGTPERPYEGQLEFVLHGHRREANLPIYGNKGIFCRNGTVDMHGIVIEQTWNRIASTIPAGSNQLVSKVPLDNWQVGHQVVVATTGDRFSQGQTEVREISLISADKMTLTFTEAFEYEHKSLTETDFYGETRDLSGEFALLTRNIVVRGDSNPEWNDEIKACDAGFDPGEFSTQTCFLGRFGEETGSDEYGSQIMFHGATPGLVTGRLSYIEVTHAGQAFQLGRYPIHFHLNGDMTGSYVKGCAIHKTFNRAVNIHGSHNVLIENTVIYNIMGGAFFLEDGIETGNVFKYNLALFVKSSTSLLNDDITPAAFWATNPNNTYLHNAAAGGTHFGWWYRMHTNPDGPSRTTSICPKKVPLGLFENNTVHSQGWFGMWIFEDFFPMEGGGCSSSTPKAAVFKNFTVWNCEKGFEAVNFGYVVVDSNLYVDNEKAGIEWKKAVNSKHIGPNVINSKITGSKVGVKIPYGHNFWVDGLDISNVDKVALEHTEIQGTCVTLCGAFPSFYENLSFGSGVPEQINWRWKHEGILNDFDGSLCGTSTPSQILPNPGGLIPTSSQISCGITTMGIDSIAVPSTVKFIRFAFNNVAPSSLEGKDVRFTNEHGSTTDSFDDKRMTHKKGWAVNLPLDDTYYMTFDNAELMTNISFDAGIYGLEAGTCFILALKVANGETDQISIDGSTWTEPNSTFTCDNTNVTTGNWFKGTYDGSDWVYIAFKGESSSRKKRASIGLGDNDISVDVQVIKCFFDGCIPPRGEDDPPRDARPDDYTLWNELDYWDKIGDVYTSRKTTGGNATELPTANSDVTIADVDDWVLIKNYNPPALGTVFIRGALEIDYETDYDYVFTAKYIIIYGGHFFVGWPESPMIGTASINLSGDMNTPWYSGISGSTISNMAIGVFGGFDIHGPYLGDTWARLGATASAGSTSITLESDADISGWASGDLIVLTTTCANPAETEERTIASVNTATKTITVTTALTYTHHRVVETVSGQDYIFSGYVSLLSRRVSVKGQDIQRWGARILVGVGQQEGDTIARRGFIRATNTEFKHMGQEGFTESWDPRYAIAIVASSNTDIKPTNIENCSFHELHNSALGVYGSEDIPIKGNVVHRPVGNGIVAIGANKLIVDKNIVSYMQWTGAAYGRNEPENIRYESNFRILGSQEVWFKNNVAAGSERIGFGVAGEDCDSTTVRYDNNFAVGALMGVGVFHADDIEVATGQTCTRWSGFTTWKNVDYGIYYNGPNSFRGENNVVANEVTGTFMFIFGPSAVGHLCGDKTATVLNSIYIGSLTGHDCSSCSSPSGVYISTSGHCRGQKTGWGSRYGVVLVLQSQAPNNSPLKPCANNMAYNALCGKTNMTGNTFKNFGPHSTCDDSFAVGPAPASDDANHPATISGSTVINTDPAHLVYIRRPNIGKINPSDCVDMDCDGLKKCFIEDTDGTFSGAVSTFISHAEFEWSEDSNNPRGIGDYRGPKAMVTDLNGNRIGWDTVAPSGRGIMREPNCQYISVENAGWYRCVDVNDYEMMVMESMDADTEMRRLSPVAVASDGYLDLLNGPQDHGWCSGYTCQKRLSTFILVVRSGKDVLIYLSSTEPKKMRFFLIHPDPSAALVVGIYYTNPRRLDIFLGDDGTEYVLPTNGIMTDGELSYQPDSGYSFMPNTSMPIGSNYVDSEARIMYFVVKPGQKIWVVRAEVIVVSINLPFMTTEQFFGANLVTNLATFLGVPLNKCRVVSVVSENSNSGRKRRSTSGITVTVEAGNGPANSASETGGAEMTQEGAKMVDACQSDQLDEALGAQSATCNNVAVGNTVYETVVPSGLRFEQTLAAQHEGVPLATQPTIRAYDSNNDPVPSLGIDEQAWEITASIRAGTGHASAVLGGTLTITAVSGWFNFTDLEISHAGSAYIIDFNITAPASAVAMNLTLPSAEFDVNVVPMIAGLYSITAGDIIKANPFSMTLDLRDSTTNQQITDISWRGHNFTSNCGLVVDTNSANLTGNLVQTFDSVTGTAVYNNLVYSGNGFIVVACQIESTPAEFSFTFYQTINVYTPEQASIVVEKTSVIVLRFLEDFNTVVPLTSGQLQLLVTAAERVFGSFTAVRIKGTPTITSGSIILTFTVEGSTTSINLMQSEVCSNLTNGIDVTVGMTTLTLDTFMTVDGVDYYSACGASNNNDDDDDDLHPAIIALIVAVCVLVLIIAALLLLWKFKILPKTKTHGGLRINVGQYPDNGRTVFLGGPQQKVEDIFYKQKNRPDMRPPSSMAAPVTTLYDELDINNATTRHSPLPNEGLYKEDTMTKPGN